MFPLRRSLTYIFAIETKRLDKAVTECYYRDIQRCPDGGCVLPWQKLRYAGLQQKKMWDF